MARRYRRSFGRRSNYRRGGGYRKGGYGRRGVSKAYRRKQGKAATYGYFKNGLRSELKYFDFDAGINSNQSVLAGWNAAPASWTGIPMALTNMPTAVAITPAAMSNANNGIMIINKITQGTDIYQRIGREVIMKSLYLRLTLNNCINSWMDPADTVNLGAGTSVRIMVLYDTQTNNVAETSVTIQQILKMANNDAGGGAGNYASGYITAFQNLDYRDRWNVILDKVYDLGDSNTNNNRTIKIYKKFGKGGLPVTYTGSTGTTINTGALWFVIGATNGISPATVISAAQNCNWMYFMTSRIRYTDS